MLRSAGIEAVLSTIGNLLIPRGPPARNAVPAIEVGRDWSRGARGRHVVREFQDRARAEAYLARLGIPVGWCAALIEVESEPTHTLGFRPVRTLLLREGPSARLVSPRELAGRAASSRAG